MHKVIRSLLAFSTLVSMSTFAQLTLHIDNRSSKPLEIVLNVPKSNLISEHFHVTQAMQQLQIDQINPACTRQRWRCNRLQLLISQWGKHAVFVQCPKFYQGRRREHHRYYRISGKDFTHLTCTAISQRQWQKRVKQLAQQEQAIITPAPSNTKL